MKTQATLHCHGFNEHDRKVVKSLLVSFGDMPNTVWRYADEDSADLVLVDCDNLLAVRDAARGYLHARHLVACSNAGASCDGALSRLAKPLRPRHVIDLLLTLDPILARTPLLAANDAQEDHPMMFPAMI